MRWTAAILMHILGNVGEMREITEGADDVQHVADRQGIEQCGQFVAGAGGFVSRGTAEKDRRPPDRLDTGEPVLAGLRPQNVAEDAAQETGVVLERSVLVD